MSTSKALESMTDAGKFENLIDGILRCDDGDYKYLIQTGVNIEGKTIKSPIDEFCLIPGSNPPHYILVENTTTAKNKLMGKWINDTEAGAAFDGDLIKSYKHAQKIKEKFPDAKFTVVLVTNHRLNPDFLLQVYSVADDLNIQVDIWEQSRLVNFLNNKPEGHWLRKKFLNINAEILSESLLADICNLSLDLYKNGIIITDFANFLTILTCVGNQFYPGTNLVHKSVFLLKLLTWYTQYSQRFLWNQRLNLMLDIHLSIQYLVFDIVDSVLQVTWKWLKVKSF